MSSWTLDYIKMTEMFGYFYSCQDVPGSRRSTVDQHWWEDHGDHSEGAETPTQICSGCSTNSYLHAHEEGQWTHHRPV